MLDLDVQAPGGYQLVGRTVPIWSGHRQRGVFEPGKPWLLRFFDRVVWHPVAADELLDGCILVEAPMVGSVWRIEAQAGEQVREGDLLIALEAMKLELGVQAPADGTVLKVLVEPGQHVAPGAPLAILAVGA